MLITSGRERRRLAVFSHPNHELAIFGFLQRFRPHLLFLSDGGGPARVAESRRALASLRLLEQATFLDVPEAAYYAALLQGDARFCTQVVGNIRARIDAVQPEQVLRDAVELYNPVHDLSLPLVLHAAPSASVFAVPLVYQRPGEPESYDVQRLPPGEQHDQEELHLTNDEVDAKFHARDQIYHQLTQQLGALLNLSREHAAMEVFHPVRGLRAEPDPERSLRYEWRGRLLRERGAVQHVITHSEHYRPLLDALAL